MATQPPSRNLKSATFSTPLGSMVAVGDDEALYLLEFGDQLKLKKEIERLEKKLRVEVVPGSTKALRSIEKELSSYFAGKLKAFKTPLTFVGSSFQQKVWRALQKIPFGKPCSYKDIAKAIKRPTAFRAVARANATNRLAIIVPCHRVIKADGSLSGYAAGCSRKQFLLDHEKSISK